MYWSHLNVWTQTYSYGDLEYTRKNAFLYNCFWVDLKWLLRYTVSSLYLHKRETIFTLILMIALYNALCQYQWTPNLLDFHMIPWACLCCHWFYSSLPSDFSLFCLLPPLLLSCLALSCSSMMVGPDTPCSPATVTLQLDVVSNLYHQESVEEDEIFEDTTTDTDDGVSPREVRSQWWVIEKYCSKIGKQADIDREIVKLASSIHK